MSRGALLFLLRVLAAAAYRTSRLASHLAVGLLRRAELEAAIGPIWTVSGAEGPRHRDGLRDWEELIYGSHLSAGERVLLIGCGTGRELLVLARRGYAVEGLDPSAAWLDIARSLLVEQGLRVPLHLGRAESFEPCGSFGAVIFSWYSYSYIPDAAARLAMLRRLRDRLTGDGRMIFSYIPREVEAASLELRLASLAAVLSRSDWRPQPGDVFAGGGPLHLSHYEHRFSAAEIEAEIGAAGLRVVAHERGAAALVAAPCPPLLPDDRP